MLRLLNLDFEVIQWNLVILAFYFLECLVFYVFEMYGVPHNHSPKWNYKSLKQLKAQL